MSEILTRDFTNSEKVWEPTLILAKKIVEKHPYGFLGALVYGHRRVGKSIYALKTMQQVFMAYGCEEEEAWRLAMDSMIFDTYELLQVIHELAKNAKVWPVLTLDDAGVAAGSMKWFSDRKSVQALNAVFDTMGTVVSCLILTTPTFQRVLRFLRDAEDFYRIDVTPLKGWQRKASAYRIKLLPSGTKMIMPKSNPRSGFVDEFSTYLPKERFHQYWKKRL
ncbi:MAG: hypothetical protein JRD89_16800, partial [Deltaproteobacteria bacterium]|nr:hypothetical protein [Deltaproteobacteria bacterium]